MVANTYTKEMLVTTYLEMTSPHQFKPALLNPPNVQIKKMQDADVRFYRYLYREVGEKWFWRDRLLMTNTELRHELEKSTTHVYVLYVSGNPAGYIELSNNTGTVEVAYFGLREAFHGQGLGKYLLSYGVQVAWEELGAHRIWLHTCNLDSPYALTNYQKRGFNVYLRKSEPMPERYQ